MLPLARAYNAFGSAYVWEDGTISLALSQNSTLYIKHFIISQKQYEKIAKILNSLLFEYSQKRDALQFTMQSHGKVIEVEVIGEEDGHFFVKPVLDVGTLDGGYRFILPKNKLFYNELLHVSSKLLCVCKGFFEKEKAILLSRFEKDMALFYFSQFFEECMQSIGKRYEYKHLDISLNKKSKNVTFVVIWKTKPSTTVISFLQKELNQVFGRCNIIFKELKHAGVF